MKYREVAAKLRRLGCVELPRRSGGSHRKWLTPPRQLISVIPDWASHDLKLGTIRAAVQQLGLDWQELLNS